MAYRRKQGVPRNWTVKEDFGSLYNPPPVPDDSSSSSSASSLAAKAIRASSAYHASSLSSAYGHSGLSSPRETNPLRSSSPSSKKDSTTYEYTSMKNLGETKQGFWGNLARKAKAILDDENADVIQQYDTPGRTGPQMTGTATRGQYHKSPHSPESRQKTDNPTLPCLPDGRRKTDNPTLPHLPDSCRKTDNPTLQKGLNALSSSLNYIGGTIGNAFEEGLTVVENRTADIIQETRKLQIRKKGGHSELQNQARDVSETQQPRLMLAHMQPQMHNDLDIQLKASRDVAMAMAAKAKVLLRELKTVKADLAFAKERCAQLEEENRILRESRDKGDNPEDDDLIRLQLETLLAEKARLAQENSVFARENRFLREIVEYHQLTMQDVVYLDEGSEEVTEVYPIKVTSSTNLQSVGTTPPLHLSSSPPAVDPPTGNSPVTEDVSTLHMPSSFTEVSKSVAPF